MNNTRRKEIDKVLAVLSSLSSDIEQIMDDEQMAFDNLPENLQYSMRGEAMDMAISSLQDAIDNIDEVINSLEEARDVR